MKDVFGRMARVASDFVGSAAAFLVACSLILAWAALGPFVHFSNGWQLAVNNGTNVLTFLIVFLIQHTQNRDTKAMRLKLDELLRTTEGTRPALIDLDRLSEDEIASLENQFKDWRRRSERQRSPRGHQ